MANRNTTIRDRHRAAIKRGRPPCGLCGEPIDYDEPNRLPDGKLNPKYFVVDHIIALGPDPSPERMKALDVISNKQAAHRDCNRKKSDKEIAPVMKRSGGLNR